MLATLPEFRDVDFSHLQLSDSSPGSAESVREPSSSFLWIALVLSLLLHLFLLLFEFSSKQLHQQQIANQTLHINLRRVPATPNALSDTVAEEVVQPVVAPRAAKEIVVAPAIKGVVAPKEKPSKVPPATRVVIEPLTAQELAELTDNHNSTTAHQDSASIAENVFHPGLRAQLTTEANKPKLARAEESALQTYTDPAGAEVMKISDKGCMRSPSDTKVGAPKNWYFAGCGGQSESEKMMERVNGEVKKKVSF
ncbi:hypothetical protein [Cellvibrio sp. OA-2007]|uniref:hypothetical protein n=1 Tax=Cellvibrio sp. OA-2007 TaxID=529823 RepID=UPI000781A9E4|nr:hypothetical protein [Cellvibrio sp. OA-2007]